MLCQEYRVYFEDTDCGGVVYHSNYLKFCERARTDFVRECFQLRQCDLIAKEKKSFVVAAINSRFLRPARLDDLLKVKSYVHEVRHGSVQIYQEIFNEQDQVIYAQNCRLALVDLDTGMPTRLKGEWLEIFTKYAQKAGEDFKLLCSPF